MSTPELAPIPFERFVADVHALADAITGDDWRPDYLVGIGRGGLVPATFLSHRLGIPAVSLDRSAGLSAFADDRLPALAALLRDGHRLLLVDDINDSGETLAAVRDALADAAPARLRAAVLLDNVRSRSQVDYRARRIDRATDKRWFVFPWEAMAPDEVHHREAVAVPDRLG